jgi:hypothetical protein
VLRIMADHDVEGHLAGMLVYLERGPWSAFWASLNVTVHSFPEFGLSRSTPDAEIWQLCQERGIILFTGNRNLESDDSLEATIRRHGTRDSLPVLTVADALRMLKDSVYLERVAVKLIELLMEIDRYRGAGRIYIP